MIAQPTVLTRQSERFVSLDVFRGIVMVFLMTETTLDLPRLASYFPDSRFWQFIAAQTSHAPWTGCRVWDLIQPSFMLMVGMALPFSLAARRAKGASRAQLWGHAIRRAVILIVLGIFLRSMGRPQTYFTFEDVITQIGLGYPLLFWLALRSERTQWVWFTGILIAYWALFAFYPLSTTPLMQQYATVEGHVYQPLTGFLAHWNIHDNPANAFDRWFLNLFPRESAFIVNGGGYHTLNFVPSLATMLLGLIAGQWMQQDRPVQDKVKRLFLVSLAGLLLGLALHYGGLCPIVKRIWTPAWTLFSGGWVLLLLAVVVWVVELGIWQRGTFWFVVVGANSMAAYLLHWTIHSWMVANLRTNLAFWIDHWSEGLQHLLIGGVAFAIAWYLMVWLYRRKIFVRI